MYILDIDIINVYCSKEISELSCKDKKFLFRSQGLWPSFAEIILFTCDLAVSGHGVVCCKTYDWAVCDVADVAAFIIDGFFDMMPEVQCDGADEVDWKFWERFVVH